MAISAGDKDWTFKAPDDNQDDNMYQKEHDELFASIRNGKPINKAIMGRMATDTGQLITWEQALNSKEDLTPERYEWNSIPAPAVAMPGVTKFV